MLAKSPFLDVTGGDGQRQYDPKDMLAFAWGSGLEDESPETLYMLFVEHQQKEGLRQEELEQQEMLMLRRARMSECKVEKLLHPHMPTEPGQAGGRSRSRLATEPIWVVGATVGLPGKLRELLAAQCVHRDANACRRFTFA